MAQNAFFLKPRGHVSTSIERTSHRNGLRAPTEAVKRLDDHYLLLHKYLAHLTWERVSKDSPAWDYPNAAATDVIDVADAWSTHLASADWPTWEAFRPRVFLARQTLTG